VEGVEGVEGGEVVGMEILVLSSSSFPSSFIRRRGARNVECRKVKKKKKTKTKKI